MQQAHGSSPRTWGTPPSPVRPARPGRFIPTHVGNTPGRRRATRPTTVHPHARGEHSTSSTTNSCSAGSSPRTWGTLCRAGRAAWFVRFIPTHVGNTVKPLRVMPRKPVHPHARGEHPGYEIGEPTIVGSSPRTWGTQRSSGCTRSRNWFIPTHVGNTKAARAATGSPPVHPHARGEH